MEALLYKQSTMKDSPETPQRVNSRRTRRRRPIEALSVSALLLKACITTAIIALLLPSARAQTAQVETCYKQLAINDANGDAKLDRDEYAKFLIGMSGGAVDVANDPDVPFTLYQIYLGRESSDASSMPIYGAAGQEDTREDEVTFLDSFCADLYVQLYSIFKINVENSDCTNAVFLADAGWDDVLARANFEFLVFIAEIGERSFDPILSFDKYNARFDIVFNDFATNEEINIGAEQDQEFVNQLCQQTAFAMAVSAAERGSAGVVNPTAVISSDYTECFGALAIADATKDETLSDVEYVTYVNEISGGTWEGLTYMELPSTLRANFDVFVTDGLIQITGLELATAGLLKAGKDLTQLETFCPTTYDAILVAFEEVPSTLTQTSVPSSLATSAPSSTPTLAPTARPSVRITSAPTLLATSAPTLRPSSSPSVMTDSPTTSPTPAPTISAAAFQQCKMNMIISDISRDNQIDSTEYMRLLNRMTNNAFSTVAYEDLEPVLGNNFVTLEKGNAYIDVTGSKPGQTPTDQQLIDLHEICRETLRAIDRYNNPVPTVAPGASFPTPVPAPSTQTPTAFQPPTISNNFFQNCKSAMVVSDISRDNKLEPIEYVRFLNRLTSNEFSGLVFDQLAPMLELNYYDLRGTSMFLSVAGSKPGQIPSDEESDNLYQICTDTDAAIYLYYNPGETLAPAPSPDGVSDAPPRPTTLSPTVTPEPSITDEDYQNCKTALVIADLSRDDRMDESEYVRFLNRLYGNIFLGSTYSELNAIFRTSFDSLKGGLRFLDIDGSKPGQNPTEEQIDTLKAICIATDTATQLYNDQIVPSPAPTRMPEISPATPAPTMSSADAQRCEESMALSDLDLDGYLNQPEYIRFLNRLEDNQFLGFKFSQLSPGLQANYNNLLGENGLSAGQSASLGLTCAATFEAIDRFYNPVPTASLAQCKASMALADATADASLDKDEYVTFLNNFAENEWENSVFSELPYILQGNFEWIILGRESVDITGADAEQSPTLEQELYLEWICNKTDLVIEIALSAGDESPTLFSQQCLASMVTYDIDGDDLLSKDEFVRRGMDMTTTVLMCLFESSMRTTRICEVAS
jgi:hypothetical protein